MTREAFLRRVESEAGVAVAAEARDHLDASIQARLELGLSPEEAEREALAAFGDVQSLKNEARRREPRIERPFLLSCLAVVAFYGALGAIRSPELAWALVPLYVFGVGSHVAFIVASVYARRVQARALGLVLAPLWVGWSVFLASSHVVAPTPQSENDFREARAGIAGEVRSLRESAARIRRETATLIADHSAFLRESGVESPSRRASFTQDGRLRLFRRANPATAAAYWDAAVANGRTSDAGVARNLDVEAQALEDAARASWWPNVPSEMVVSLGNSVGPAAVVYDAIHLTAWTMGWLLRRRSRRRGLSA